ncbi:hypothetical protein F4779DRAFT_623336 [Xylariaceae sp. FL0662B]|nr:hypothetical protein F4779DRAFT_623336 [Xylariaceae sp. FL0662B]
MCAGTYGDDRGWVRRHHYSLLEEPTEPPPPPGYRSPSPDNAEGVAAAFGAQVDINADPAFDLSAEAVPDLSADAGFDFVADPMLALLQETNHDWDGLPDFNVFPGPNQF